MPLPLLFYTGCSLKCCISRGAVAAERLISDLQYAGCIPCGQVCPTCVLQSCGDEDRTRTGSQQALGCCSWGWWLSLFAEAAAAEDGSSFSASVLCESDHTSSGGSAASSITAWRFYVQKAAAGQWESWLLPTAWLLFLWMYLWIFCTIQQSPHPSLTIQQDTNHGMTERGEEQDDFFC